MNYQKNIYLSWHPGNAIQCYVIRRQSFRLTWKDNGEMFMRWPWNIYQEGVGRAKSHKGWILDGTTPKKQKGILHEWLATEWRYNNFTVAIYLTMFGPLFMDSSCTMTHSYGTPQRSWWRISTASKCWKQTIIITHVSCATKKKKKMKQILN